MGLSFWESLKRRKIYKVATVYAITASAIIKVANVTFAPIHIPEWTLTSC